MAKTYQTLFLFLIVLFSGCSLNDLNLEKQDKQQKKKILKKEPINDSLYITIDEIIYLMLKNHRTKLNHKFIHPKYGYFDVYLDKKVVKIDRKKSIEGNDKNYYSIADNIRTAKKFTKKYKIEKFEPVFFCSPKDDALYGWNKEGLFFSDKIKFPIASNIVNKKNKNDKEFADLVDKLSYKVVLSEAEIVFFITYLDDKWYITLFDRASFDCSGN